MYTLYGRRSGGITFIYHQFISHHVGRRDPNLFLQVGSRQVRSGQPTTWGCGGFSFLPSFASFVYKLIPGAKSILWRRVIEKESRRLGGRTRGVWCLSWVTHEGRTAWWLTIVTFEALACYVSEFLHFPAFCFLLVAVHSHVWSNVSLIFYIQYQSFCMCHLVVPICRPGPNILQINVGHTLASLLVLGAVQL